ncbi:MAG: hypothetical protein ACI88A_002547 [Paraglaciecola sp.]|jgi:hypothetical protein
MSIHHRTGTRIPLVLDVEIQHMGKKLGTSCTRNINPYGAFIELPSEDLVINDFVEIHFKDKQKKDSYLLQKGLVKHRGKEGIGVLFAYDKEEFRAMLEKEMAAQKVPRVLSS